MDLTKGVPLEALKQKLSIYERYVRMGFGPYSTRHSRDKLEFNKGAVKVLQGMVDDIETLIKAQDKPKELPGGYTVLPSGAHYTGD